MSDRRESESRTGSAAEAALSKLLQEIIGGGYGPRARLPAERELATRLAASRVTVRGALSKLEQWNVVSIRRGSGVTVRDWREWSMSLLPAWLKHSRSDQDRPGAGAMLRDVLGLRRDIILSSLHRAAGNLSPGDLGEARRLVHRAWEERARPGRFAATEFDVFRAILAAACMWTTLWLFNDLYETYTRTVGSIGLSAAMPETYVETMNRCFDDLERGDGEGAAATVDTYIQAVDGGLLALIEMMR